ncbi:MAG TPA: HIT family protein [Lachnospiraceae bacterium]|nr:HIT family protein [Lachnospiraceae bacterium]
MKDDNCIFCKIAAGEIPSQTIYEDEDFRAILDLGPATKGHTLILPKEHAANLFELSDETAAKLTPLARKLGKQLVEKLGADGLNVIQNNGEVAGQTVMHYHLHLIPRYKDDGQHLLWKPGESTPEGLKEICDRIKG